MRAWLVAYVGALIPFLAADLLWLGVVARGFYRAQMGPLLADRPRWGFALLFYALYGAGVVLFAVLPGVKADSLVRTALLGAALGLLAYATYNLTGLAVLRGFPARLAAADIAWGTLLTAAVATCGHLAVRWAPQG